MTTPPRTSLRNLIPTLPGHLRTASPRTAHTHHKHAALPTTTTTNTPLPTPPEPSSLTQSLTHCLAPDSGDTATPHGRPENSHSTPPRDHQRPLHPGLRTRPPTLPNGERRTANSEHSLPLAPAPPGHKTPCSPSLAVPRWRRTDHSKTKTSNSLASVSTRTGPPPSAVLEPARRLSLSRSTRSYNLDPGSLDPSVPDYHACSHSGCNVGCTATPLAHGSWVRGRAGEGAERGRRRGVQEHDSPTWGRPDQTSKHPVTPYGAPYSLFPTPLTYGSSTRTLFSSSQMPPG